MFVEKFEQFMDPQIAVGEMRELAQQLTVHGRLLTPDKQGESAEAMLRRIVSIAKSRGRTIDEPDGFDAPLGILAS